MSEFTQIPSKISPWYFLPQGHLLTCFVLEPWLVHVVDEVELVPNDVLVAQLVDVAEHEVGPVGGGQAAGEQRVAVEQRARGVVPSNEDIKCLLMLCCN